MGRTLTMLPSTPQKKAFKGESSRTWMAKGIAPLSSVMGSMASQKVVISGESFQVMRKSRSMVIFDKWVFVRMFLFRLKKIVD